MAAQSYRLEFDGYWTIENIMSIPSQSGIYCVYTCRKNMATNRLSINKLVYIGESENVNYRVLGHQKETDWRKHLGYGETLCFSFAPIKPDGARKRAEAALIYEHAPPENTEYVNNFPFDKTTVFSIGCITKLKNAFTVLTSVTRRSFLGY